MTDHAIEIIFQSYLLNNEVVNLSSIPA